MLKKYIFACAICLSVINLNANDVTVVNRAAVDVGSGGMKVTVAEVDTATNKINKIFYSVEKTVALKRDMQISKEKRFSERVQQVALNVMAEFQVETAQYKPQEWAGIATAASRQAVNAQDLYDRILKERGVKITIIPQEEEGRIGFQTAVAVSGLPKANIISLDSGSASFQLATEIDGKLQVVEGQLGYIPALTTLVVDIRGGEIDHHSSPNPVSLHEANQMVALLKQHLPMLSDEFKQKLCDRNNHVVAIGNEFFIYAIGAVATGKTTYTKEELWDAIIAHSDLNDADLQQFPRPEETLVSMIYLYSIMEGLGIDQLTYCNANGNCEGLLIDPTYWTVK